jgi:hypothetical protein
VGDAQRFTKKQRKPRKPLPMVEPVVTTVGDHLTVIRWPLKITSEGNAPSWGSWRTRQQRTKATRASIWYCLTWANKHLPSFPCRVTFERIGPRLLDSDNLAFAFKGCRDELAKFYGVDDGDPRWHWEYQQAQTPAYGVRIIIESHIPAPGVRLDADAARAAVHQQFGPALERLAKAPGGGAADDERTGAV